MMILFPDTNNTDQQALQGRLSIGYYITKKISIFAGGGLNYIYECEFLKEEGGKNSATEIILQWFSQALKYLSSEIP